jgi:hypothetical protein
LSAIDAFLLRIKRKNTRLILIVKRRTTTVFTLRDNSKGSNDGNVGERTTTQLTRHFQEHPVAFSPDGAISIGKMAQHSAQAARLRVLFMEIGDTAPAKPVSPVLDLR